MPAVCRSGIDVHSCGSVDVQGSPDVFVNGFPVHRVGDGDSHGGVQAEGSDTVYANGLAFARVGDANGGCPLPCPPNPEATGSPDVFADEKG